MTDAHYSVSSLDTMMTGLGGHTDLKWLPDDVQTAIIQASLPADARRVPIKDAPYVNRYEDKIAWALSPGFTRRYDLSSSLASRMPASASDMSNSPSGTCNYKLLPRLIELGTFSDDRRRVTQLVISASFGDDCLDCVPTP